MVIHDLDDLGYLHFRGSIHFLCETCLFPTTMTFWARFSIRMTTGGHIPNFQAQLATIIVEYIQIFIDIPLIQSISPYDIHYSITPTLHLSHISGRSPKVTDFFDFFAVKQFPHHPQFPLNKTFPLWCGQAIQVIQVIQAESKRNPSV